MNGLLVIGDDQIISVEALSKLDQRQFWREKSDEVFDVETLGTEDKKKIYLFCKKIILLKNWHAAVLNQN